MRISDAASNELIKLLSLYTNNISVGDTITARVIAVESGILLLQLSDGGNIKASVQTDAEYNSGDVLKLEVTGIKQGQVYVKELEHKQAARSEAYACDPVLILKDLKLPVNKESVEVVKMMLDMDSEPEAGLIENALRLINEKNISDPGQAVLLALNGMENSEEYFPLLDRFAAGEFNFIDKWQNLEGLIRQSGEETLNHLVQEFLLNESIQEKDISARVNEINYMIRHDLPKGRTITEEIVKNIIFKLSFAETGIDPESIGMDDDITGGMIMNNASRFLPGFDSLPEPSRETIAKIIKSIFNEIRNETAIKEPQNGTVYPRTKAEMENITARFMPLLSKNMLEDAEERLLPEIDKWIDDIEKKIAVLKKVFAAADRPDNERVMPALREIETAVRFFHDIRSYQVFVQIPVILRENTTLGELYIMKRKGKRGKIKADDFSLFLSLTTQYIGVIDAFIHVRSRNVLIKITVDDEKYFDILAGQHKALYEGLKGKGYNLYEIKHVLRDEGINILNAVKKASEIIIDNRKIDYRV
ncbi:MAG: hypothetical protein GX211_03965 [Clostridiaceae bacterium]|jgi:hypothetical protein|nr:hypothetical protein [Clostridiaceae bacterium]